MPLFFANAGFWYDERPHKRAGVTAQNLEIAPSNSIIRVRFTQKRSFVAVQLNVRFAPKADTRLVFLSVCQSRPKSPDAAPPRALKRKTRKAAPPTGFSISKGQCHHAN